MRFIEETVKTDVLVIGGGGAAARAALEAYREGGNVLVVVKGQLGESGTTAHRASESAGLMLQMGVEAVTILWNLTLMIL